jgi:DHA1 family inner membrane transport protein
MVAMTLASLAFMLAVHHPVTAVIGIFLVAFFPAATMASLTLRLMDSAGDGKALASSLNHSALNVANALGAWIGGVVLAAGLGYTAPAAVGAVLALGGLVVLGVAKIVGRRPAL